MSLTPKQELAAQTFIENGGNRTQAYIVAYSTENMKPDVINVKACELFKLGKMAVRVLELQESHRERHNVTIDSLTEELDEARKVGKEEKQASAMTGATMGKAKLHGLITDKSDITSGGKPIKNEFHIHPVKTVGKD